MSSEYYAVTKKFMQQFDDTVRRIAEVERDIALFRAGAKDSADHYADACAEIDRLRAQWERLTSDAAVKAAYDALFGAPDPQMPVSHYSAAHSRAMTDVLWAITAARDAARGEG
jgi:predicted aminopeptidase